MDNYRRVRPVLREPVLHFLLLGLGLFILHGWIAAPGGGTGERIVITQGRIGQLAASFALMHQRPPAQDELDGLVREAIREEILYREAKALGLDQDDTIVRRRLRQKLEFVSEDVAAVPEPTDAQLQAYLQAHQDEFGRETRYVLTQVYLDPQRHGQKFQADIKQTLLALQRAGTADAGNFGDSLILQHHFDGIAASELTRLFGARFEVALRTLPTGQWQGPVPSGYGVHLVLVSRRDDGRTASLGDVRDEVRREWLHAQGQQANERYYADLRKRYQVTVERASESNAGASALAVEMQQ